MNSPSALSRPGEETRRALAQRAADLLIDAPCVDPTVTNRDVFDLFDSHAGLIGLPVVEEGHPIGLINRNIFMDSFARPFHREVYSHKSCIAFMDKAPLVADASLGLQELSFLAVADNGKALNDGFIIAADGLYRGMGSGIDLVRAIAELQAEKNRQVMESIDYASVIQRSFLRPSREALRRALPDHVLHWEPRDHVGGDYVFCSGDERGFFATLFDCTGHGVPGAFMTMIMASFIEHAQTAENRGDPAAVMSTVNRRVKTALGQIDHGHTADDDVESHSDDGMDAAFIAYDAATRGLCYVGAHQPLFLLRPGAAAVEVVDGNRHGVGYAATPMDQHWDNHVLCLDPGTLVCLATDGLFDQVGGPKRIAFGKKRLLALLLEHREQPLAILRAAILDALAAWQGAEPRRDDLTFLVFRV